jgi:ABC-type dipeptide/oligopeptide/nickel transport system permease subunit
VFPSLMLSVTILGLNLFGDGIRDVLDPRMRI